MARYGRLNQVVMDEAAAGVARGEHLTRLCERLGIGRRTLARWRDRESFQRRVAELRAEALGKAMGRTVNAAVEGASALERLLRSHNEAIVLGAARALLQVSGSLFSTAQLEAEVAEMNSRLAEVETVAAAKKENRPGQI